MRRSVLIVLIVALNLSFTVAAQARSHREMTYQYTKIWSTVVRFIRVDNRFAISEKDKKAGYILFEYKEDGRPLPASIELIPAVREGRHYIRASLRISSMPRYVESVLFNKLLRKLREEYGDQPPARLVKKKSNSDKKNGKKGGNKSTSKGNEPPESEADIEVDEDDLEESQQE